MAVNIFLSESEKLQFLSTVQFKEKKMWMRRASREEEPARSVVCLSSVNETFISDIHGG